LLQSEYNSDMIVIINGCYRYIGLPLDNHISHLAHQVTMLNESNEMLAIKLDQNN
jgi:hypothetical protein